jgi:ATP-binding cassette subfamily B protein
LKDHDKRGGCSLLRVRAKINSHIFSVQAPAQQGAKIRNIWHIAYFRSAGERRGSRPRAWPAPTDFIRRLPQGYHTVLAERGQSLWEGQRQLVTIARAILADPSILVLDEATSSVDSRTELALQKALHELMRHRTSFVIAHRLSIIFKADRVIVIGKGREVEQGTHTELIA